MNLDSFIESEELHRSQNGSFLSLSIIIWPVLSSSKKLAITILFKFRFSILIRLLSEYFLYGLL